MKIALPKWTVTEWKGQTMILPHCYGDSPDGELVAVFTSPQKASLFAEGMNSKSDDETRWSIGSAQDIGELRDELRGWEQEGLRVAINPSSVKGEFPEAIVQPSAILNALDAMKPGQEEIEISEE